MVDSKSNLGTANGNETSDNSLIYIRDFPADVLQELTTAATLNGVKPVKASVVLWAAVQYAITLRATEAHAEPAERSAR